jgi:glyoxylase-like metal-dependent hydrolase (beta-lactamase superfamily II)
MWRGIADAGIGMLRIPTPFQVGRVNCYVLDDEPLTLIDTGPNSGKALTELERQLESLGHRIEDLELIVITHQHLDHMGLVDIVAKRCGAEVAAIDVSIPYLENYAEETKLDDLAAAEMMRSHGISEDIVAALLQVTASFHAWGSKATVTRPLHDGETLSLRDRELQIQHRPGHSPSDTVLWDEQRSILVAGDHLIKHISSNALITRPLGGSGGRLQALLSYIESMQRTRDLPAEIVLAGHGDPFTGHRELIDHRLAMHQRRAEKLYGLIRERARTGHELAQELWGDVAVTQAFLTLSEVIGHVDLLINAGHVRESEHDGLTRYEAITELDRGGLGDLLPRVETEQG